MNPSDIEQKLDENFLDVWTLYLDQCVARHRKMVELAGSPTKAFIAQIVYWHELLLLRQKGAMPTYGVVLSQINQSDEKYLKKYIRNKTSLKTQNIFNFCVFWKNEIRIFW